MSGSVPVAVWNPASRLDTLFGSVPRAVNVNLVGATPAIVYPKGLVLAEVAATPGLYEAYNPGASDGSQNPKLAFLAYACSSLSASGAGAITAWGEWPGVTQNAVPAYMGGIYRTQDLVGMDANALTVLAGALVEGTLGTDEVDSITISATGGTWGLGLPAVTTETTSYPAITIANTALAWNISAANLAIAINAALAAVGTPAYVGVTGGVGGTNPLVITFHGALSNQSFVITTDATQLTGGGGTAAITRSTHGAVGAGIIKFT